jgi:rhodanese-related sulfurtransferase
MRFFAISFALVMITFLQPAGMYPSIQSLCYSMMEFPDLNGIVEPREYEASYTNKNQDWSFHYTIVNDIFKGGIIANTTGWCAIGLDPESKMKGADIIQGWISDGVSHATDSYGTKEFGPHPFDTTLGGTNNIQYFALSHQQNSIHFEFRRKLSTGDTFDKQFPTEGDLRILWAYGSLSDHSSIHSQRGYGILSQIEKSIRSDSVIDMEVVHESLPSYQVIDISDQYMFHHIQGAIHCPHEDLLDILPSLDHTKPTVVYGTSQKDVQDFTHDLLYHDFREPYILDGTLSDWISKGYATEKGSAESIILKFYIGLQDYFVNNKKTQMDVEPVILENRTCLPIVYVVKPLHGTIQWFSETKKISIQLDSIQIDCWIDNPIAKVNGKEHWIDEKNHAVVPVILPPGRTFVPIRFIAESLGCEVFWDGSLQEITIHYSLK